MKKSRCGIVGIGTVGRLYREVLTDPACSPDLTVVALADPGLRDQPHLHEGISAFSDYRDLLHSDLSVVLIATPPSLHFQIAQEALEAGKDVLVEKPPARTAEQCKGLISLASRTGRVLFFAFHARYNLSVEHARKVLADRNIAEVKVNYEENVLQFHRPDSWVHREGVLRDSGINVLSILTSVLPPTARLTPQTVDLLDFNDVGGETRARLGLALNGHGRVLINLDWRHGGPEKRQITVTADADTFTIDVSHDRFYQNGELVCGLGKKRNSLRREYEGMVAHFQECLRNRASSCSCGEVAAIEAACELARRGNATPGIP